MSDEQRPETSGERQTGDNSSSSGESRTRQPQSSDTRRSSSSSSSGATGEVNNSGIGGGGGGGGRHGSRRRHRGGERENQTGSRRTESSINMDELRELADLIAAQGFTEFEMEKEGFRLRLSRNTYSQNPPPATGGGSGSVIPFPAPPTASGAAAQTQAQNPAPGAHAANAATSALAAAETPSVVEDLYKITSPIVGTFYRAPSPTSDVFVNQGSHVESETVVCIIEAMKLMNEIQAEVSGTIEKIYVENGQPVEYGQALFGVKKH